MNFKKPGEAYFLLRRQRGGLKHGEPWKDMGPIFQIFSVSFLCMFPNDSWRKNHDSTGGAARAVIQCAILGLFPVFPGKLDEVLDFNWTLNST